MIYFAVCIQPKYMLTINLYLTCERVRPYIWKKSNRYYWTEVERYVKGAQIKANRGILLQKSLV